VRFNPKARLDTGRTRQASGGGRGGAVGRGISVPGGVGGGSIGGIVVTLLIAVAVYYFSGQGGSSDQTYDTDRYAACQTGEDANESADCARVAVENSLDDYWDDTLGSRYHPISGLTTFTGSVDTGCGAADAAVGPFYCPVDETIYLDTGFFDDVLERELGGPDGGFVEAYVLAHEFGHHIQIRLALEAAASVGDDRIQEKTQGQVSQESWTHGSAEQRMRWFRTGYENGSLEDCDTFGVPTV
jgi:predicted metalloprotease